MCEVILSLVEGRLRIVMLVDLIPSRSDGTLTPGLVDKLFDFGMMNDFLGSEFMPDLYGYALGDPPFYRRSPGQLALRLEKRLDPNQPVSQTYGEYMQLKFSIQKALSRWLDWVSFTTQLIANSLSDIQVKG